MRPSWVQRARALSSRTAELAAKLVTDKKSTVTSQQSFEPRAQPDQQQNDSDSPMQRAFGVRATSQGLLFVQPATVGQQVGIVGDFNGWDPAVTFMKHDEQLGVWQACIPVKPGRYHYRLVVDGLWVKDPYNNRVETNPLGELNSVVEVTDARLPMVGVAG